MFKSVGLSLSLAAIACAQSYGSVPFDRVMRGNFNKADEIEVVGKIDVTGVNFYSLIELSAPLGTFECIALILSDTDQRKAKDLHGYNAIVRGRFISLTDLEQIVPSHLGQIDGRSWSGTRCAGDAAIYVKSLQSMR